MNEILTSITWMDLEGILLSEISQTKKDKCQMISLPVEPKSKINLTKKQKQTHRYREHFDGCQIGGG